MTRGVKGLHNYKTETRHHPLGKVCNHFATYRLTCDHYDDMHVRAAYRCEICRKPGAEDPRGMLSVDHLYSPWHIRGLLCSQCNSLMSAYDGRRDWRPNREFCLRARLYVANSWQRPDGRIRCSSHRHRRGPWVPCSSACEPPKQLALFAA